MQVIKRSAVCVAAALVLAGCWMSGHAQLEDAYQHVPPELLDRLCAELDEQVEAVAAAGAPISIQGLAGWWPTVPREVNAAARFEAAFHIQDFEERLRQIRAAAAMPQYAYPLDAEQLPAFVQEYDVPWGAVTRESFRTLNEAIYQALEDGRCDEAAADLEAGLGMLRQLTHVPLVLAVLVQEACAGMVLAALEETLTHCRLDESALISLQRGFRDLDVAEYWARAVYVERLPGASEEAGPRMEAHLRASRCLLSARAQVRRDLAASAIALHRYRVAHGAWPGDLQALVPDYLAQVPRDPFSGGVILMSHIEGALYVHSAGYDGVPGSSLPNEVRTHDEIYFKVGPS